MPARAGHVAEVEDVEILGRKASGADAALDDDHAADGPQLHEQRAGTAALPPGRSAPTCPYAHP